MIACLPPRSSMGGLFDVIFSPKTSAENWLAGQRAAAMNDVAYQRAMLVAQLREVASEATTEAAVKFAIAGVFAAAFSYACLRLATRGDR